MRNMMNGVYRPCFGDIVTYSCRPRWWVRCMAWLAHGLWWMRQPTLSWWVAYLCLSIQSFQKRSHRA